jgi:D-lactate dehydrogenase
MKIIIYSTKDFERNYLLKANRINHELTCVDEALNLKTAELAKGHDAAVVFTGDDVSTTVIDKLHEAGVKYIAIRAVGYDNIDIKRANELGIKVANVPVYSPYAIAEHAVALMLALSRKLILANIQVHHHNFTVGNIVGFDLHKKTVGIIGTGRIGGVTAGILHGFGCRLLGYDIKENKELSKQYGLQYVHLKTLCQESDIISIHTPLNAATKYLINKQLIEEMKQGVMLINTARGAIMNTQHVIEALESGKLGYLGTDVYENEKGIFFYDYSKNRIHDEMLKKLMSFPNVIVTPHQAFATQEALTNIADTTFYNLDCWSQYKLTENELTDIGISDDYVPMPWVKMKVKKITHKVSA